MTTKDKITLPTAYPTNAITGKEYSEGNIERLLITGLYDQRWATYRQWFSAGTQLMKVVNVNDAKNPDKKKRVPRRFYVFNICQVEEIK